MKLGWLASKLLTLNDKVTDNPLEKVLFRRLRERDFILEDFGKEESQYIQRSVAMSAIELSFVMFSFVNVLTSVKIFQNRKQRKLTSKWFVAIHAVNLIATFNIANYIGFVYFFETEPESVQRLREKYL